MSKLELILYENAEDEELILEEIEAWICDSFEHEQNSCYENEPCYKIRITVTAEVIDDCGEVK